MTARAAVPYGSTAARPLPHRRCNDGVRTALLGAALAVAMASLSLRYLSPPYPSDQMNYLRAARIFPGATHNPALVHQYVRVGITLPARLAIAAFGYSQAAYYAVPILSLLVLVLAVYGLGCLLFSRSVGAAAAVVTVVNPLVFPDLSMPLPDVLATALFTAAVALAVALHQHRRSVDSSAFRRRTTLLAIGALLSWSYLTREFVVFLWPVVTLLLRRTGWRALLWVALPLVATLAGELALGAAVYGDPLVRWGAVSSHGESPVSAALAATYQDFPRRVYARRFWQALGGGVPGTALRAALLATVIGALLRPRRVGLLLGWVLALYVPLTLLGGVLDPAHPRLRLQLVRYWFPVFPALLLGGLGTVWLVTRWCARRRRSPEQVTALARAAGAVAGAVVLVLAAVPVVASYRSWSSDPWYRANGATQLEAFRSWLHEDGGAVRRIWTDSRTAMVLPLFLTGPFGGWQWRGERHILGAGSPGPAAGDLVVVYSGSSILCGHCRAAEQAYFGRSLPLPRSYALRWASKDRVVEVYEVR